MSTKAHRQDSIKRANELKVRKLESTATRDADSSVKKRGSLLGNKQESQYGPMLDYAW